MLTLLVEQQPQAAAVGPDGAAGFPFLAAPSRVNKV